MDIMDSASGGLEIDTSTNFMKGSEIPNGGSGLLMG